MIQFNIQFKVESKIFIQQIIQFKKFKNYSKIIQFKKFKKVFIQIGKIIPAWENSEKMQNGPFFSAKRTCYSFFLWISHFFIHSKIHSIVRQKYSFKEFIHSIVRQKIHSKNLFIQKISKTIYSKNSFIQRRSKIIHSKNLFIQKNPKLFIQRKYSFKWKMDYRPGLNEVEQSFGISDFSGAGDYPDREA